MTRSVFLCLVSALVSAAPLYIRVTDENGKAIWTRLEVHGPNGKMYQAPGAIREVRRGTDSPYRNSFVVNGECTLDLEPGRYTVIAEHGLEYERVERSIDVPADIIIKLSPWIRLRDMGWWSGDMHVHRPPEDVPGLAQAEDTSVSVVITMWNRRNLWADRPFPTDRVVRVTPNHLLTLTNAEDERGGGAWMLHGLTKPLPLAVPGRWYPPGIGFVRMARRARPVGALFPWFDSEKLIWWEVPVLMALDPPDSLGLLHNHFHQYGVMENEAWGRPRDRERFPSREGFALYTLSLYYRYLNLGMRLPPSAGSATGVLPNPLGYNRMYVKLEAPLTIEKWYAGVKRGDVFVSNGPALTWDVKKAGSRLRIAVKALAREAIDRIEIVANGEVIAKEVAGAESKYMAKEFSIDAGRHSWIAARCFLKTTGTVRMAHTAPFYLDAKWDPSPDARYFLAWIDELIEQTNSDANRFENPTERREVLTLYERARRFYQVLAER